MYHFPYQFSRKLTNEDATHTNTNLINFGYGTDMESLLHSEQANLMVGYKLPDNSKVFLLGLLDEHIFTTHRNMVYTYCSQINDY